MARLDIDVELDVAPIQELLQTLEGRGGDMKDAWKAVGEAGVSLVRESFKESKDPYGERWQELAPETLERKGAGKYKPLIDEGKLRNSFNSRAASMGVEIGTPYAFAAFHQGDPGHPSQNIMPQRSFLPLTDRPLPDAWREEILDTLEALL